MHESTLASVEGLRFFGRTVAATTHELVNVLNIVGELAGLQDDLLRAAAAGKALDPARLAVLAERTRNQAERGQALLRQLNRFAHSVDQGIQRYDLGDVFECAAALFERFARLARVRLEIKPPASTIVLEGNPFAVHLALSLCLEAALAGSSDERTVRVSAAPSAAGASVAVESADPLLETLQPAVVGLLQRTLAACPGEVVGVPDLDTPGRFTMQLRNVAHHEATRGEGVDAL